jgi:hypothetical protein
MRVIDVDFLSFREVHISRLIGEVGVYVIWDSDSQSRPRYIGEGEILSRFSAHNKRKGVTFKGSWDGYIGFIESTDGPVLKKDMAKIVECLLLQVAKETNRIPSGNRHPGSVSKVGKWCKKGQVRLNIRGLNPFSHPRRPLTTDSLRRTAKKIEAWWVEDEQDWRYQSDFRSR